MSSRSITSVEMNPLALNIPEIVELIARHLEAADQLSYLRVSKLFYNVTIPYLWHTIHLRCPPKTNRTLFPTGVMLQRFKAHIRKIHFQGIFPMEYQHIDGCKRLQALLFTMPTTPDDMRRFIAESRQFMKLVENCSSTLRSVTIHLKTQRGISVWNVLAACPKLTELEIRGVNVAGDDWPLFLQVWGRVHTLSLSKMDMTPRPTITGETAEEATEDSDSNANGKSIAAPGGPRELSLEGTYRESSSISSNSMVALVRTCHSLESLRCRWEDSHLHPHLFHEFGLNPANDLRWRFLNTLTSDPWTLTALHSLDLSNSNASDIHLEALLNQIHHLKVLKATCTLFGPLSYNALIAEGSAPTRGDGSGVTLSQSRRHCKSIETLYIDGCSSVTGAMIQRFLASCPKLERFAADRITVTEIAQGQHWACSGLKHLDIYLAADDDGDKKNKAYGTRSIPFLKMQRFTFEKLNRLTKLERLVLTNDRGRSDARMMKTLDMRMESGLCILRDLKSLREISFKSELPQKMDVEEAIWIADHWPNIKCVEGVLNKDEETSRMILAIIHPVTTRISGRE
ncbi:hypothetical protein BGX27_009937 [Mortierella sp. AM989]|nr:hypothetical protein BGX27_009937 [Mortierella sp. AM989]